MRATAIAWIAAAIACLLLAWDFGDDFNGEDWGPPTRKVFILLSAIFSAIAVVVLL